MKTGQGRHICTTLTILALAVLCIAPPALSQARTNNPTASPSPARSASAAQPAPPRGDAGRVEDAVRTFFGVLRPHAGQDTVANAIESLYARGTELERSGRLREAVAVYDQALKLRYDDPRLHMAVGRVVEQENPALAIYHFQSAFRYSIEAAAEQVPAVEMLRRFLVGRYIQYALPIEDPKVSLKLLDLAASLAPEDPRIHAHIGTAYFYAGEFERSIQESRNAIALGLEDGLIYTNIAAAYAQLGKKAESESNLVAALSLDELDINEALNAIRQANESDTLVTFNRLFGERQLKAIMDNSTKGLMEASMLAWRENRVETALAIAKRAVDGNPRHSYSAIVLGDIRRSKGDTAGAKAAYATALQRNPRNELALPRLGDLSYSDNDYTAAADYYSRAMDMMSGRLERIDILDRTAVALAKQGKHDAAIVLLDKWLRSNQNAPEFFSISVRRAGILSDAARTGDAERALKALVDRDKLNPAGYIVLHEYYTQQNQPQKAIRIVNEGIVLLEAARDRDPREAATYRDLARLYETLSKTADARKALLAGGLRTGEKRYFANALFAMDAETEAYDVLKSWVEVNPSNAEALLSYGWVAAKVGRDLPNALAYVNQVAAANAGADPAPIRRTRAYIYFAMKDYEKAIDDIKGFLTSDELPQAGFFHRLWGTSADALKRSSEALEHMKRAVQLDPEGNADLSARIAELEGATSSLSVPAVSSATPAATPSAAASTARFGAGR
jgi:tetratricopeptide (TPR) repeat protein